MRVLLVFASIATASMIVVDVSRPAAAQSEAHPCRFLHPQLGHLLVVFVAGGNLAVNAVSFLSGLVADRRQQSPSIKDNDMTGKSEAVEQ